MAYSRYELPLSAFDRIPGLFSSIGMNELEVLMEVRQATLFDSDDHVRNPRKVYVANVSGHEVKIYLRKSPFEGKTTAFARLAADGSILPPDLAQTLDLAFARIGARISSVERPMSLREVKSGMKELYDVWVRGKPRANLAQMPDAETVEAAIRNRDEIRKRLRHSTVCYLAILVFIMLLGALASKYKAIEFLMSIFVLIGFPTMIYFFVQIFVDRHRFNHWPCPRCGKRFMPYASYPLMSTRCRYCTWEIPDHLR